MNSIMKKEYIRNLGFWQTIHISEYEHGVRLAKRLLEYVAEQAEADSKKESTDNGIEALLRDIRENNIREDHIPEMFERLPEFFAKEKEPAGLPEKESY